MIAVLPYVIHPKTAVLGRAGGVEISVKMKNYLDISLNALQAIGTATRKEQTSAHA